MPYPSPFTTLPHPFSLYSCQHCSHKLTSALVFWTSVSWDRTVWQMIIDVSVGHTASILTEESEINHLSSQMYSLQHTHTHTHTHTYIYIPQFVVTHRHAVLRETEKIWQILNRPKLKHVRFLRKYETKQVFCGHSTLTEGVFVNRLNIGAEWQF